MKIKESLFFEKGMFTVRFLKRFIFFAVIVLGIYLFIKEPEMFQRESSNLNQKDLLLERKEQIQSPDKDSIELHLNGWLGEKVDTLIEELGEPIRKDLSYYGYTNYVYMDDLDRYALFGVKDDEIVSIIGTGLNLNLGIYTIGSSRDDVLTQVEFQEEVKFRYGTSVFTIQLSEEDLQYRPIVQLNKDEFIQFYFDMIDDYLVAIRILDRETLLKQGAFNLVYRGKLPEKEELTDEEQHIVDRNEEMQVVEITNVIRNFYGKDPLLFSEEVQEVALLHSEDMAINNYFSHDSISGKNLADRLEEKNITYRMAGENIASNYTDAMAVVIGWLNSEGHREALLKDEFTHTGVGVYEKHYTQNFLHN